VANLKKNEIKVRTVLRDRNRWVTYWQDCDMVRL